MPYLPVYSVLAVPRCRTEQLDGIVQRWLARQRVEPSADHREQLFEMRVGGSRRTAIATFHSPVPPVSPMPLLRHLAGRVARNVGRPAYLLSSGVRDDGEKSHPDYELWRFEVDGAPRAEPCVELDSRLGDAGAVTDYEPELYMEVLEPMVRQVLNADPDLPEFELFGEGFRLARLHPGDAIDALLRRVLVADNAVLTDWPDGRTALRLTIGEGVDTSFPSDEQLEALREVLV